MSVDNAAQLLVEGKAESFHFGIKPTYKGISIPALGIFIFIDSIAFDYRMGKEWTEEKELSFFRLLVVLKKLTNQCLIRCEEVESPPNPESIILGLQMVESGCF